MKPSTVLPRQLADARRAGASFEAARPDALAAALRSAPEHERGEWADVLGGMTAAWRTAWERLPLTRAERTLLALADPERVPAPERECERCGQAIPPTRPPRVKWCGAACARAAARERERVAAA